MSETKHARTMVNILQDRIEKMEEELEKASEILEMLVGVVQNLYGDRTVVSSGPLTVDLTDLEETKTAYPYPAPFTGTPVDQDSEED